ncbi:toprim domain-containing protein [Vibrio sp.]|uniref:toprim domain-containing protein n=1 Tax=Vibrio sp. TaxID=678 RepID=UPI003D097C54
MRRNYEHEKQQLYDAIQSYGYLRLLRELTDLDGAIDYIGTQNSKRFDICPDYQCSEHQLWNNKGNFVLFKDAAETGAGYCYKCKTRFSAFDYLMEYNGYSSFKDMIDEVKRQIGFKRDPNYQPSERKIRKKMGPKPPTYAEIKKAERNRSAMNKAWSEAVFLYDEQALPAAKYFARRGVTNLHTAMKDQVKFHPAMTYFIPIPHPSDDRNEQDVSEREELVRYCQSHPSFDGFIERKGAPIMANMGNHPCILIMVRTPLGEPRRLHRIYLDEHGNKASFAKDGFEIKRMMPGGYGLETTHCACFIDPPSPVVGLGEGLETVLAVKQVTAMPMDCTINAGGLANYMPREGTQYVYIFEDKDESQTGEIAAKKCEERLLEMGISVIRVTPPLELGGRKSVDWLDVLNELGPNGFPLVAQQWQQCLQTE